MQIDLNAKAQELLTAIANSIYDRDPTMTPCLFNTTEIETTKLWLEELLVEVKKDCVCI